jgi:hypothetical protein
MAAEIFSPKDNLADLCEEQRRLNPEFREPVSARAADFIGENFPERPAGVKTVESYAQAFRMRLLAIIEQEKTSPMWQRRLGRAQSIGPGAQKRVAATDDEFREAPVSLAKTVQKALTPPVQRIVPSGSEIDPANKDLSGIIIDPAYITDTLLKNLGLEKFQPPKGAHPDERMDCHAQAIPAIKEMLASLRPLDAADGKPLRKVGRFRLMRIGDGRYEGYIFGTQSEDGHGHFFRTDLMGAYRRITHIRQSYEDESAELNKILFEIRNISREISTRWAQIRDTDELAQFRAKLLQIVDGMRYVRDRYKVGIRKLIEANLTFKTARTLKEKIGTDESGLATVKRPAKTTEVFNPGAVNAGFTRVGRYAAIRREHAAAVMSELQRDQLKLRDLIAAHELPFDRFYQTVNVKHRKFVILREDRRLTPAVKKKIVRNLCSLREECSPGRQIGKGSGIVMQPFASFGYRTAKHIDETVAELEKKETDRESAATSFLKIYLVSKVHYLFHELQKLYDEFLSSSRIPNYNRMHFLVGRMKKEFGKKRLDEQMNGHALSAPEFNEMFGKLFHLLNALTVRIKHGKELDAQAPAETHTQLRREMRDLVHDFNFEELLTVSDSRK